MKRLLALLSILILLPLTACGDDIGEFEDEDQTETEEVESFNFSGIWEMTMQSGGGSIVATIYAYCDGTAESIVGQVTTPNGLSGTANYKASGQNWATYELSGMNFTMDAMNGSSHSTGTFSDEDHASGTITSQAGSYGFTAVKIGDLPPEYAIVSTWMLNISGYGEGEVSRFQRVTLNSDGSADIDWQKVQMEDGQIHEGELPDYYDSYTYDGETVVITADGGNFVLTGEYVEDGESGVPEIQGTWTNTATGESGEFYGVSMGLCS